MDSSQSIPIGRKTRVGVIQMTSTDDVESNLKVAQKWIEQGKQEGAEVLILPECYAYLGADEQGKLSIAESLDSPGPILSHMQNLAQKNEVHLILGGHWEKSKNLQKVFNTCIHIDPDGNVVASYRKIHLFDVNLPDGTNLMESKTIERGDVPVVTAMPFGLMGLSICYDIRFPELYRKLVDLGAIALAVPAAFTLTTGKDHWHVLLCARAIEQQSYVLAAAQTGHHYDNRRSYGHALIVDPWGTILAQCGEGEGVAIASVDPSVVLRVREQLPSLKHRCLS